MMLTRPAAALALACASFAGAATIVDTGFDASAATLNYTYIGEGSGFGAQFLAASFSLAASTTLTGYRGWIAGAKASDDLIAIAVRRDDAGVPGALLFQSLFNGPRSNGAGGWIGVSGLTLKFAPGSYWLSFEVPEASGFIGNMLNGAVRPQPGRAVFYGGTWHDDPNATIGVQIDGVRGADPGVPEPASWTLAVAGFGAVGAMLRRRTLVARAA